MALNSNVLGCNQNMNFGEEKTFCLLSCVRINKQNKQSLNNISQMLENITENPTKIILKSFSIYVPGWVGIISSINEIGVINPTKPDHNQWAKSKADSRRGTWADNKEIFFWDTLYLLFHISYYIIYYCPSYVWDILTRREQGAK